MEKDQSPNRLIIISFICLLLSHGLLRTYINNLIINGVVLVFIAILIYHLTLNKGDGFGFLLIIYFCAHFQFAKAQGGAYNQISFLIIGFLLLQGRKIKKNNSKADILDVFLIVLIVSNILGVIFNNNSVLIDKVLGVTSFFGYIFMFVYSSNLNISNLRIRSFITVTASLIIYGSAIAVFQFFRVLKISSPMFDTASRFGSSHNSIMIGSAEMSGEYGLLVLSLLAPFALTNKNVLNFLKINKTILFISVFCSLLVIFLSRVKSVFILSIILIVSIFIISASRNYKDYQIRTGFYKYVILLGTIFVLLSPIIKFNKIFQRFEEIDFEVGELTFEGVVSGQQIHRGSSFQLGLMRFKEESFFIGYGWGLPDINRDTWLPEETLGKADSHSLYLSLPVIFGWFGSISFVMIILITIVRLFQCMFIRNNYLTPLQLSILGFTFLLCFFLIDQYKINILRLPHYFMVLWIWLGLANSVYRTYKSKLNSVF